MEAFKRGDRVIVVLDEQCARKSPHLVAGDQLVATVTARMKAAKVPSYRVSIDAFHPFLEIQIPDELVIGRAS